MKLIMILACIGITLVISEIMISEFNDGGHSNYASWVAGCYMTLSVMYLFTERDLACVLCAMPTITILVVKVVRRMNHEERV